MAATRQDAWNDDEDLLLAETVLRYIREGGTQLKAFEEVGKKLSRTGAACGFRWNSFVRKQYQEGIELAKVQRKESKKQKKKMAQQAGPMEQKGDLPQSVRTESPLGLTEVTAFIEDLYERAHSHSSERERTESFERRTRELEMKVKDLSDENQSLKQELAAIKLDHRVLLEIMEKARKMIGEGGIEEGIHPSEK